MLGVTMLTTACNDIDKQNPERGTLTKDQVQATNEAIPERMQATFSGMFSMMGRPHGTWVETQTVLTTLDLLCLHYH